MTSTSRGSPGALAGPDTCGRVLERIGWELAQCEDGVQSDVETCEHLRRLVRSGLALMPARQGATPDHAQRLDGRT